MIPESHLALQRPRKQQLVAVVHDANMQRTDALQK